MNNVLSVKNTKTPEEVKVDALTNIFTVIAANEARLLIGKFLTVVEASLADPVQREAVKSVVKQLSYEPKQLIGTPYQWVAESLLIEYSPESSDNQFGYFIKEFRNA